MSNLSTKLDIKTRKRNFNPEFRLEILQLVVAQYYSVREATKVVKRTTEWWVR